MGMFRKKKSSLMDVAVHTKDCGIFEFKQVSECRYEAAYVNRKPTVLVVYRNTEPGTWAEPEVVAEFHAADIIGWSRVEGEGGSDAA